MACCQGPTPAVSQSKLPWYALARSLSDCIPHLCGGACGMLSHDPYHYDRLSSMVHVGIEELATSWPHVLLCHAGHAFTTRTHLQCHGLADSCSFTAGCRTAFRMSFLQLQAIPSSTFWSACWTKQWMWWWPVPSFLASSQSASSSCLHTMHWQSMHQTSPRPARICSFSQQWLTLKLTG
jgi:hypothetical protein